MDSLCLDTHLNSPLSLTILFECLDHLRTGTTNFRTAAVENNSRKLNRLLDSVLLSASTQFQHEIQAQLGSLMSIANKGVLHDHVIHQFHKYWTALQEYVPEQLTKLEVGYTAEDYLNILKMLPKDTHYDELLCLYNIRCFFEEGVCLSSKPPSLIEPSMYEEWDFWKIKEIDKDYVQLEGKFEYDGCVLIIHLTREHCIVFINNETYLITRGHFLMLSDIFSQRFIIYLTSLIANYFEKKNYPLFEDFKYLFSLGDTLLNNFGNSAYSSLSYWEALIISEILARDDDPAVHKLHFKNQIHQAFIASQSEEDMDYLGEFLKQNIDKWLVTVSHHQLFQLFGMYRIWGHPTIDEIAGVKKLKSIACRERPTSIPTIHVITWKWREYFCLSYFKDHSKWPSLRISEIAPDSTLINALRDNMEITPLTPGYRLDDWKYITFEKTFSTPEKFELSEMIADKATSLNVEDLKKECRDSGTIGASHKRSVILQWLKTNYSNPSEFLEKIDKEGFDSKERCVGVHPKERELKIFARLFGLLTIEKRLYVVITEAMIADFFFKYFPEITMTFDAVTLQTRIHSNTAKLNKENEKLNKKHSNSHTVIVNMDFNKWNSYMREEETEQIFKDMDQLFGYSNVISRTHEMFKDSMMYLADGTITPYNKDGTELDSEAVWHGHLGGIEGLRQKGWTIFTVVMLKYIAEKHGVKCQIMGQGDNQVLIIDYPKQEHDDIRERHTAFLHNLNQFLSYIGPPLKMEETWSSSMFFIYGKYPVYKGLPLSMSCKKICRTMRLTNEGFQNLESTLSSITANAAAATASDYDPIIPYIIGSFETIGAIDLHTRFPFYRKKIPIVSKRSSFRTPVRGESIKTTLDLSPYDTTQVNNRSTSFLINIAIYPCILGGYPTLQICDLMNHGFPDPLSLNIWSLIHFYKRTKNHQLKLSILNMLTPIYNYDVNPEMICQDPVSLNLLHSSSGSEKIKRMVFEFLTSGLKAENQLFLTFLQLSKLRQSELSVYLSTMKPFNPRVANSILSATIVGRAQRIVSKINKTSTIIGLMLKFRENKEKAMISDLDADLDLEAGYFSKSRVSMADLYGNFEENYLLCVIYGIYQPRITLTDMELHETNSSRWAQYLRETSWRLPITGVTVMVPQETFKWCTTNGLSCNIQDHPNPELGYISVLTDLPYGLVSQHDFDPLDLPLGPFKPFFGSATKNKVQYEGGELKKTAPPIMRGALDLLCLIGWGTDSNSNLSQVLKEIFSTFTDLNPDLCIPEDSMISGTVEHRWQDLRTSHSSTLSILYSLATWSTIITNYFDPQMIPGYAAIDNFNISFQTVLTWINNVWSGKLVNNPHLISTCFHLHVIDPKGIMPIYEGYLETDDAETLIPSLRLQKQENNPYCFVSMDKLILDRKVSLEEIRRVVSHTLEGDELNHMLTLSTVSFYLTKYPFSLSYSELDLLKRESLTVIPVSIALNLDIERFLNYLYIKLVISYLFMRSSNLKFQYKLLPIELYEECVRTLESTPNAWFRGMVSLLLNLRSLNEMRVNHPTLELPKGTPPSLNEKIKFFKGLFVNQGRLSLTLPKFLELVNSLIDSASYKTSHLVFNPGLLRLIPLIFSPISDIRAKALKSMYLYRKIFCEVKSEIVLNSNSNLYYLFLQRSDQAAMYAPFIRKINKQDEEFCYVGLLDKLSKDTAAYNRVAYVTRPRELENKYSGVIMTIRKLPIAASLLVSATLSENLHPELVEVLPRIIWEVGPKSLVNHIYKISNPITTASYKLVSILRSLDAELVSVYNMNENETNLIGCFGDGVGGYTTTMGRIFPNHKLFYNTFYEFDKLSSIGIDNFIPASLGMFPSILDRVESLHLTTEVLSDLTNESFESHFEDNFLMDIIVSDAEGGGWENPWKGLSMTVTLLKIAYNTNCNMLIQKSYASRVDMLYTQFLLFGHYYKVVRVYRSHFSSVGSTEVFLIGYQLLKDCYDVAFSIKPSAQNQNLNCIHLGPNRKLSMPLDQFCRLIQLPMEFRATASNVFRPYSLSLDIPEWKEGKDIKLENWIKALEDEEGIIIFYLSLLSHWRREFNLIRFTESSTSHFKLNYLTPSVKKKIIYELFLFNMLRLKSENDFYNMENYIQKAYVHFYQTINNSWCIRIDECHLFSGANSSSNKIVELLDPATLKDLFVSAGRLLNLKLKLQINWMNTSLTNLTIPECAETDGWWKEIKITCLPIGMSRIKRKTYDRLTEKWIPNPIQLIIPLGRKNEIIQTAYDEREPIDSMEQDELLEFVEEIAESPKDESPQSEKPKHLIKRNRIKLNITKNKLKIRAILNDPTL